jgi:hypothetical protein
MKDVRLGDLFDGVIKACRERAKEFTRFDHTDGAIRISYLPQSQLGLEWIKPVCKNASRYEMVARISDDGNFVLNRATDPVDTYSISAMRVASCLRSQELEEDVAPDEKRGFASAIGTTAYQLLYDHRIFALMIVSVSGAIPEEDELVAKAASEAVEEWRKNGPYDEAGRPRLFYIAN